MPKREGTERKSALIQRLPLLVLVVVGLLLFNSNLLPQNRKLVWQTSSDRGAIQQVELQVWTLDGELLKREQLRFAAGAPAELTQELTLSEGDYQVRYVIERGGAAQEAGSRVIRVEGDETYYLPLGRY